MDLSVIPDRASKYDRDTVAQAVYLFAVKGHVGEVAELTGIPGRTIHDWRKADWWDKALATVRAERQDLLDARADQVIMAAVDQVMDRLEHGEQKLVKNQLVRVPVTARDAAWIGAVWFDKQRILRGLATTISQSGGDALGERLRELERKASAKVIPADRTADSESK